MNFKNVNEKINVLIPDGEKHLALNIINCLSGVTNLKIHILSKFKFVETRFSNKISSFTLYAGNYSDKEWVEILQSEISSRKINVLLPVHFENIKICSDNRDDFIGILPNLVIPEINSLETANNKWSLYKLLEEWNINRPFTFYSDSYKKDNNIKINYPILVKPLEGKGGDGIKKINDKELLERYFQNHKNFIIQNYIQGFDIDMSVLCENGRILAHTIQKGFVKWNLPYQPYLGVEFLNEKKIVEIVETLMNKLKWTGVAHIDLRYDEVAGIFKVIEINPRFWGSIEASKKVGVNFPYLYCLTSLGVEYLLSDYQHEKYVNNRGLIKVLKSKFLPGATISSLPKYNSLRYDITDPLPKIYKYGVKFLKKIFPKRSKLLKRFKYEIY